MLKRLAWLLVAFPAAVLLVTLAVSNRHSARLILDPFRPETPAISIELPLYAYLFGALVIGVVVGGMATWFGQGQWRRTARARAQEAMRWRAEAERLTRERDAGVASGAGGKAPTGTAKVLALARN